VVSPQVRPNSSYSEPAGALDHRESQAARSPDPQASHRASSSASSPYAHRSGSTEVHRVLPSVRPPQVLPNSSSSEPDRESK
jgi:hypothetical protein